MKAAIHIYKNRKSEQSVAKILKTSPHIIHNMSLLGLAPDCESVLRDGTKMYDSNEIAEYVEFYKAWSYRKYNTKSSKKTHSYITLKEISELVDVPRSMLTGWLAAGLMPAPVTFKSMIWNFDVICRWGDNFYPFKYREAKKAKVHRVKRKSANDNVYNKVA